MRVDGVQLLDASQPPQLNGCIGHQTAGGLHGLAGGAEHDAGGADPELGGLGQRRGARAVVQRRRLGEFSGDDVVGQLRAARPATGSRRRRPAR